MIYRVLLCLQYPWLRRNTRCSYLQTLRPFGATGFAAALQVGSQASEAPVPWLNRWGLTHWSGGGLPPEQDHVAWTEKAIGSAQLLPSAPDAASAGYLQTPPSLGHIPQLLGRSGLKAGLSLQEVDRRRAQANRHHILGWWCQGSCWAASRFDPVITILNHVSAKAPPAVLLSWMFKRGSSGLSFCFRHSSLWVQIIYLSPAVSKELSLGKLTWAG